MIEGVEEQGRLLEWHSTSYHAKRAEWTENHPNEADSTFELQFLQFGQDRARALQQAEDEYSEAATEIRRLGARPDDWDRQSSRFLSGDSLDTALFEAEVRVDTRHLNKPAIRRWIAETKSAQQQGRASKQRSAYDLSHLHTVVLGKTPWDLLEGRKRRHIEKWNNRRSRVWLDMVRNWNMDEMEVDGPPSAARPDSLPLVLPEGMEADCGVEINGHSLRYTASRQRRV